MTDAPEKYEQVFSKTAMEHVKEIAKSGQKSKVERLKKIIKELKTTPEKGIGKPERLKWEMQGLWSREISKKDRIVYSIDEDGNIVNVVSAIGHYKDK